ncbi:MAG: hypothetical protein WCI47_00025 [bacterium]
MKASSAIKKVSLLAGGAIVLLGGGILISIMGQGAIEEWRIQPN